MQENSWNAWKNFHSVHIESQKQGIEIFKAFKTNKVTTY